MEARPWPEWRGGKPITQTGLARQLGHFSISPGNIRKGDAVAKGYRKEQFTDAFARYVPGIALETATPLQTAEPCGFPKESQPLQDDQCSGSEMPANPQQYKECSGVAVGNPWETEI
jgi:hypothetical protein